MKILATKDYDDLSKITSHLIIQRVKRKQNVVLGLATGETPIKTYELLIKDHVENNTSYQDVTTVNLDEYIGLPNDHPQSYHTYMRENLFDYIDINKEKIHIPLGGASNLDEECKRYDKMMRSLGYIDLQLLGIGNNGHIGFNEPGTSFSLNTHVTKLDETTRKANSRFFNNLGEVPTHAITMGITSILKSQKILLLASGKSKAKALKRLILGEITEEFPASALKMHNDVTIIADEEALQEMKHEKIYKKIVHI